MIASSLMGVTQRTSVKAEESSNKGIDMFGNVKITWRKSLVLTHIGWCWEGRRDEKYANYVIALEGNE